MYKLTTSDHIIRLSDGALIPKDTGNRDYADYIAWQEAGNEPDPSDDLTDEERALSVRKQLQDSLTKAVQAHLDSTAQAAGYDNVTSAVTYADEPVVPKFQAEGKAFRAWRSLVWAHCIKVLDEVNSGARNIPTESELIGELPILNIA